MLNRQFLQRKIEFIKTDLGRLTKFEKLTFDEAAENWETYAIIKNLLMEIIGRAIDINEHLISELATIETAAPLDYAETFLKLAELKVLPGQFAKTISKSAGFRNAIVHGYNHVDKLIVFKAVEEAIKQYAQYCNYILKFVEKQKYMKQYHHLRKVEKADEFA